MKKTTGAEISASTTEEELYVRITASALTSLEVEIARLREENCTLMKKLQLMNHEEKLVRERPLTLVQIGDLLRAIVGSSHD